MALDFKTPSDVAQEYLDYLKATKPEVNIDQTDQDWWVRAQGNGGIVSGSYSDQRLIANDAFPQKARHDALGRFLDLYFQGTFKEATAASGFAVFTGDGTGEVTLGLQGVYQPNNNAYQATDTVPFNGATAILVPVASVDTGQDQNLLSGAILFISSPPAGVNSNASASGDIASGRDSESDPEAAARILDRIRFPPAGGTANDYRGWAINSDDAVVDASVIRFYRGLGTVGVVITAGTTDIDKAINEGSPVILIPSQALVNIVQDYIDERKPLTDCATVVTPASVGVDVNVKVRFASGDINTILAGQTLTQGQLVVREVKRAIYKTPPGGRRFGTSGYVVCSEIEEVIDIGLSASPYTTGDLEILVDRQVDDLSATGPNLLIATTQIAIPGMINVEEMD